MNQYAVPLDLELPLFNSLLDPVSFLKNKNAEPQRHFKLDKTADLSTELKEFFAAHNQEISLCEIFYTPPNDNLFIHVDGKKIDDIAKLNWIFGGVPSQMHWYSPLLDINRAVEDTPLGTPYLFYSPKKVQLEHSQSLTGPNLVQVGEPHNITNGDQERFCVSLVFYDATLNRRPTMAEAKKTFKKYLK